MDGNNPSRKGHRSSRAMRNISRAIKFCGAAEEEVRKNLKTSGIPGGDKEARTGAWPAPC